MAPTLRRKPSRNGGAAAALPLDTAGYLSGRTNGANQTSVSPIKPSLVCLPWPHLTDGELTPAAEGTCVKSKLYRDPCASLNGIFVNF